MDKLSVKEGVKRVRSFYHDAAHMLPGLIFGRFYSRYSVIFPMPKSMFFSQFSEENSQFQVLKNFENKSSICLIEVGLKMCVQHVYSGFPFTKISVV